MQLDQGRPNWVDFENYCQKSNRWRGFSRPAGNGFAVYMQLSGCMNVATILQAVEQSTQVESQTLSYRQEGTDDNQRYLTRDSNVRGLWIPRYEASALCQRHGIEDKLEPVFKLDVNSLQNTVLFEPVKRKPAEKEFLSTLMTSSGESMKT